MHVNMVKKDNSNEEFKANTYWLRGFMKHFGFSLQQKTSVAQKDPNQLVVKLVYFVLHVHHLVVVFKDAKQEIAALDKEIKNCFIVSFPNAWINTELTHTWVSKVLAMFLFRCLYLVWDSYESGLHQLCAQLRP